MPRALSQRASQKPSRPASKATAMRSILRPAFSASTRQRLSRFSNALSSTASFFNGWRSTPGTMPATSQLDWLISITAISVPSGSRGVRDRLRSFNFCMGCSIGSHQRRWTQYPRRRPIASSSGISLGDVLRLPERHPACRRREAQPGSCTERENLCSDAKGEIASGSNREDQSTDAEHRDGAARSRDEGSVMELDRRGCVVQPRPRANRQREEPVDEAKPFNIPKRVVWKAFKRVKANRGAAGVDKQSIAGFEADLSNNLYKLWNRMSRTTSSVTVRAPRRRGSY